MFFANGGGEANEGMIKLARKYSFDKYGKGRSTIISTIRKEKLTVREYIATFIALLASIFIAL